MATTNQETVLNLRGMTITIASDESIYVGNGEMTVHMDFTEPLMEWFSTCPECDREVQRDRAVLGRATNCPHCDPVDVE